MLSYEQFCTKHAQKYATLTRSEKRKRYDDYRATFGSTNRPNGSASASKGGERRARDYYGGQQSDRNIGYMGSDSGASRQRQGSNRQSSEGELARAERNAAKELFSSRASESSLKFPPNSLNYVHSLGDPFTMKKTNICPKVPSGSDGLTQSQQVFVDFTMTAGNNGTAACSFSPLAAASGSLGCVTYTNSPAYNGNERFPQPGDPGIDTNLTSNAPYAHTGPFAEATSVSIVNAGLRAKYIGKVVDREGACYEALTGGTSLDGIPGATVAQDYFRLSQIKSVTDDWKAYSSIWTPTNMDRANISLINGSATNIIQANGSHRPTRLADVDTYARNNLGILITGAEPGSTYYCRAICTVEYYVSPGIALIGDQELDEFNLYSSASKDDPDVMAIVSNAAKGTALNVSQKTSDGQVTGTNWLDFMESGIKGVTSLASIASTGSKAISSIGEALSLEGIFSSVGNMIPTGAFDALLSSPRCGRSGPS